MAAIGHRQPHDWWSVRARSSGAPMLPICDRPLMWVNAAPRDSGPWCALMICGATSTMTAPPRPTITAPAMVTTTWWPLAITARPTPMATMAARNSTATSATRRIHAESRPQASRNQPNIAPCRPVTAPERCNDDRS